MLTGCVSINQINRATGRIDAMYAKELNDIDPNVYIRDYSMPYDAAFNKSVQALIEMDMTIVEEDRETGIIEAMSVAPTPLTKEEWASVGKVEKKKIKKTGGWFMTWSKKPSSGTNLHVFKILVKIQKLKDENRIILRWSLDMPNLRKLGVEPVSNPPASAVLIVVDKFYSRFSDQRTGR